MAVELEIKLTLHPQQVPLAVAWLEQEKKKTN